MNLLEKEAARDAWVSKILGMPVCRDDVEFNDDFGYMRGYFVLDSSEREVLVDAYHLTETPVPTELYLGLR